MTAPPTVAVVQGDRGPVREFGPITRTDIVRYAGASGDFNPLHHDERYAQEAGFAGVFSMGMLQAGFLGTYVSDWLGATGWERLTVRFHEPVWPGDVVTCTGTVASVTEAPDDAAVLVEIELVGKRQTGAPAVSGTAALRLSRR